MDLGKKLVSLRKKAGLSQENLADILEVSRQTISKWELSDTSPDIVQAKKISKIFNVSLDELLDNDISDILATKISNTEKLAAMTMRIIKVIGILLIILPIVYIFSQHVTTYAWFIGENTINCRIGDKHYLYKIDIESEVKKNTKTFEKNAREIEKHTKIKEVYRDGGNAYLSSIVDLSKYEYNYQLIDAVHAYVYEHGGSCN